YLFDGVAMVSTNDVWVVGYASFDNPYHTRIALVVHWNGTQWSIVPTPHVSGAYYSSLNSIAAVSANNVWAVGKYTASGNVSRPLTMHWNGTQWSIVPTPDVTGNLASVDAVSGNDVWAVGDMLALHWDGTQWNTITLPQVSGTLQGVAAVATNDVWAVGYSSPQTLIMHWNGSEWSRVPSPNPYPENNL